MFYHARYYAPRIGRFAQADTIVPDPANPQALNRYSYVNNRPLVYIDPSGHYAALEDNDYSFNDPQKEWLSAVLSTIGAAVDIGTEAADIAPMAVWYALGLRITPSANDPAYCIVSGVARLRRRLGFLANVTRMKGTNPRLGLFNTAPGGKITGAINGVKSSWTAVSLAAAIAIDAYDYGFGPNSENGIRSEEFAAAVTVDVSINLLSAAAGGAAAGSVAGPPGAFLGAVFGVGTNFALNYLVRDRAHEIVTDVYHGVGGFVGGVGDYISGIGYVATHGFPLIIEPAPDWCGSPDCPSPW